MRMRLLLEPCFQIPETRNIGIEEQPHGADRAVTLLGDNDFRRVRAFAKISLPLSITVVEGLVVLAAFTLRLFTA